MARDVNALARALARSPVDDEAAGYLGRCSRCSRPGRGRRRRRRRRDDERAGAGGRRLERLVVDRVRRARKPRRDLRDRRRRPRTATADERGGDGGLAVSPDGRTLLFGSVYRIGVDGHGLRRLGAGFNPAWSPDGSRIAFTRNDGLYLMRADGSGAHKCTAPLASVRAPVRPRRLHDRGERIEEAPGHAHSGFPQCPAWSHAGKLAFLTADVTVAVVQPNGGLRSFRPSGCPAWSPGGHRFAVATAAGAALINAHGSGRRAIAVLPGSHTGFRSVAWSADGRRLALVGGAGRRTSTSPPSTAARKRAPLDRTPRRRAARLLSRARHSAADRRGALRFAHRSLPSAASSCISSGMACCWTRKGDKSPIP